MRDDHEIWVGQWADAAPGRGGTGAPVNEADPPTGIDRVFTAQQIAIIAWIAEGKSDWEIAQLLNLTAKSVNYHVERMKSLIDVPTRIQLVVHALRSGIIP